MTDKHRVNANDRPSLTGIPPVKVTRNAETNSTKNYPIHYSDSNKKESNSSQSNK